MPSVQKMIVCDVDGTVLPHGQASISPSFFDVIRRLTGKGVLFAVASGRPYDQLRQLFEPVSRQMLFVCLDGALLINRDCVLQKTPVSERAVRALMAQTPDLLLFGRHKQCAFGQPMHSGVPCASLFAMGEPALRVGVNANEHPLPGEGLRVAYQEDGWMELCAESVHKGSAVETLCRKFDIAPANVYAFGDNHNDRELLAFVGHPYRMATASALEDTAYPSVQSVEETLRAEFHLPPFEG